MHTTLKIKKYDYLKNINNSIKGKKIGIITNALYADGVSQETKKI